MDDSVPPGGSYTYRWEVRPEFAPTHDDANCLTWVYHSHLDAPRDITSGLIGALLTCKKGKNKLFLLYSVQLLDLSIHYLYSNLSQVEFIDCPPYNEIKECLHFLTERLSCTGDVIWSLSLVVILTKEGNF